MSDQFYIFFNGMIVAGPYASFALAEAAAADACGPDATAHILKIATQEIVTPPEA